MARGIDGNYQPDGWTVTVTYEDGTRTRSTIEHLGEFQTIIPHIVKTGHGNIVKIEMV